MTESEGNAKEAADALRREVTGIESWIDPDGCVHRDLLEKYDRANSLLYNLVTEHPCDVPEVKRLLYSSLEDRLNRGGVSGLQNAAFLTMHGLAKYSMSDPNVQNLIKRIYKEAQGSDLGDEAKRHLLEAEIELPERTGDQKDFTSQQTYETWINKIKNHPIIVLIGIIASILSIVSFIRYW